MTPDERIEALLNRAGQTISDLPDKYDEMAIDAAADTAEAWSHRITWRRYVDYILHLTDVIDRMETALENVCGERDYLRQIAGADGCGVCVYGESGGMECNCPKGCSLNDENHCKWYEYAGVPEDWRVDDE